VCPSLSDLPQEITHETSDCANRIAFADDDAIGSRRGGHHHARIKGAGIPKQSLSRRRIAPIVDTNGRSAWHVGANGIGAKWHWQTLP
jgi:hypothetical protein